jgi:signal transduction histidine kinase
VLALAGFGVFAASAALTLISRQSLLSIEATAQRAQSHTVSFGLREVPRDAASEREALQELAATVETEIATFRRRSLWITPAMTGVALLLAWGIVQSIRERSTQLSRVLRSVISAQEEERRRVARELHDETSQLVTAMSMELHAIDGVPSAERLRNLRVLLDRMHDGLHRVIVNLRPNVLDDLGLAAAIEWLAEHQVRREAIAVRCELGDLQDCRADPTVEIALFRVVQESLTNVVRHAEASAVLIQGGVDTGGRGGARIWIEIEDDGRGFEPQRVKADADTLRGVGLLGMRERMDLIGGQLQIDSARGQGTRVRIEAPVRLGANLEGV